MYQGEDKTITVSIANEQGAAYGSTSGLTFVWKVATSDVAASAVLTKSTGNGITNGVSIITITIDEADTDDLAAGSYYHECRVTDSNGDESVVFTGSLSILSSITETV